MTDDKKFSTLKEWYLNENLKVSDLTDSEFHELLNTLSFKLFSEKLKNDIKVYYLKDLQGGNNNHIEQDIFYEEWEHDNEQENITLYTKECIYGRLDVYLVDYFIINNAFDDD